ncbi:hypothetical protein DFJ74DRAFT_757833 [Hyaloraphidium curvatum]|nr:hypothetical protein DFJ74DRAFT_757833 [Hyaloraphidium curvatum]
MGERTLSPTPKYTPRSTQQNPTMLLRRSAAGRGNGKNIDGEVPPGDPASPPNKTAITSGNTTIFSVSKAPSLERSAARAPGTPPGKLLSSVAMRYIFSGQLIGEGGQGRVEEAKKKGSGTVLAVKKVDVSSADVGSSTALDAWQLREAVLAKQLGGLPGIVKVRDVLVPDTRNVNMVGLSTLIASMDRELAGMDRIPGTDSLIVMDKAAKSLSQEIDRATARMPIDTVVSYSHQALAALLHLKRHGIVHRDIKSCNFLITKDGRLVLTDMGQARRLSLSWGPLSPGYGTDLFRSPEQIALRTPYSHAVDAWGLGTVLGEMLSGSVVFRGDGRDGMAAELEHVARRIGAPPRGERQAVLDAAREHDPAGVGRLERAFERAAGGAGWLYDLVDGREGEADAVEVLRLTKRMLCWAPGNRITPEDAISLPIFRARIAKDWKGKEREAIRKLVDGILGEEADEKGRGGGYGEEGAKRGGGKENAGRPGGVTESWQVAGSAAAPEPTTPFELLESLAVSFAGTLGIRNRLVIEGIKLAAIGGAFAVANTFRTWAVEFAKRNLTVEMEFDSRDESYTWLLSYLSESSLAKTTSRFAVATTIRAGARTQDDDDAAGFGFNMPRVFFLPSPGDHIFPYNGRLLYISRTRQNQGQMVAANQPASERLTVTLLGRSRAPLISLIQSAARAYIAKEKGRTVVFAADGYGNWRRTRSRPVRPLESVVMERGVKVEILRDVVEFLGSENWYGNRGIPYRRGYLFYGPPGTGKTSFVSALAGALRLNIYVLSLSNRGLTDDNLIELMSMTPARCVLLLEDVDAAFVSRELDGSATGKAAGSLTFSGLLNAIDGVAAQEGRILCMTTNHIERLDPALIRPGRIDVQVLFDRASQWQAAELFRKFYGGISLEDVEASRVAQAIVESSGQGNEPPTYAAAMDAKAASATAQSAEKSMVKMSTGEHASGPFPNITPSELDGLAQAFAAQIPDKAFSMAQIQGKGHIIFKHNPAQALQRVTELAKATPTAGKVIEAEISPPAANETGVASQPAGQTVASE